MSTGPETAATLAGLAVALQARLDALRQDADPSWQAPLGLAQEPAPWGAGLVQRRLAVQMLERLGRPPLAALAQASGGLALLERRELLARLCALALLGRPGVLRCCVQRSARLSLQQWLGPAFHALRERSGGAAVAPEVAAWAPLTWAWVGYRELSAARAWPHPGVRRLVRLSLPTQRAQAALLARAPLAATPLAQRLEELAPLFDRSDPC